MVVFSLTDVFAILIIVWNNVNNLPCQYEEKQSVNII